MIFKGRIRQGIVRVKKKIAPADLGKAEQDCPWAQLQGARANPRYSGTIMLPRNTCHSHPQDQGLRVHESHREISETRVKIILREM